MASAELQMVIDLLRAQPIPRDATFVDQRAAMETLTEMAPRPEDVTFTPVDAGGPPAEWVMAAGASDDRALLYLHGGGYCIGSIASHRHLAADLSRAAGMRVLLVDYRLAPEHPFPAAVEDAVAAYEWLLGRGIAPGRIAVAGDSAGGGLTVATLLALRDRGRPLPAAGVCISPWADMTCSGASYVARAQADPMVKRESLVEMAKAYLAGADEKTPLASPLHADLRGLSPLLIQVGRDEVLLDDSTQLAAQAKDAGVDATLEVWDDMIHVWHWFLPMLDEAERAVARIGEFLRGRIR
jgi:acetyl esterase/lipase